MQTEKDVKAQGARASPVSMEDQAEGACASPVAMEDQQGYAVPVSRHVYAEVGAATPTTPRYNAPPVPSSSDIPPEYRLPMPIKVKPKIAPKPKL